MQTEKIDAPLGGPHEIANLVTAAGESGEADHYAGKRHFKRFAEGVRLEVCLDPSETTGVWSVYMHNVSDGGFAFWSKREVKARHTVYVRECQDDSLSNWLKARVTHCTTGIRGFLIGASFETAPVAP